MWCHNHCHVDVHVENRKLLKILEAENSPRGDQRAVVRGCQRIRAASEYLYHPDRLRYPLKRSGKRGEGKWQEVSWDQALDEVAEKLNSIKEQYGAEAISTSSGTGRCHDEYRLRFFNILGSPNNVGQGNICYGPGTVVSLALFGWPDYFTGVGRTTKCVLLIGYNPQQSARGLWYSIQNSLKTGAKLIVIDPRCTPAAKKANIWLQIRPGTDSALLLSMIHVIIGEELYDKDFVKDWCYDFEEVKKRAEEYPPEKVESLTWIPAEKIREAARLYATTKPGVVIHNMGLEQQANGIESIHARYILTAISGNIDVKGGEELRTIHPELRTELEIECPEMLSEVQKKKQIGSERFRLMSRAGGELINETAKIRIGAAHTNFCHGPSLYRAMITGKPYPVKAMITAASNPLVTQPNTKLVYQALKSLDLYVVHDFWLTPSAEIADYVFPCASWLERPAIYDFQDHLSLIHVVDAAFPSYVEGEFDRRNGYDFWRGLGIRMGQEKFWPWPTKKEALAYRLERFGYGTTFEEIVKNTGGNIRPLPKEEKKYERLGFGTATGKVELYSKVLQKLGYDPLPRYFEPPASPQRTPEMAKEYPLFLSTGERHLPFYHSEHRQMDTLRKEHPYPIVQMHPKTASTLGIEDGDWVWIETAMGRVRQKCQYFEGVDPRIVHAQHGWWFPELPGEEPWLHGVWESNINVVLDDDPDHCNPISGGWPLKGGSMCKVYRAKIY